MNWSYHPFAPYPRALGRSRLIAAMIGEARDKRWQDLEDLEDFKEEKHNRETAAPDQGVAGGQAAPALTTHPFLGQAISTVTLTQDAKYVDANFLYSATYNSASTPGHLKDLSQLNVQNTLPGTIQ